MLGRIIRRLRTLARVRSVDSEITRELDFHVRMEIERRERSGMAPAEARRTALRDFGGVGRVREEVRDARGMTFWDTLRQDVRFGVRTLRRSPGYTFAAVLILALGIGANTAIFSVVNGVLLEPLPYRSGDELVLVQQSAPKANLPTVGVSIPEFIDYRDRLTAIRDLVEYHSMSFTLLNQGEPDRVDTGVVSANFFDMLGVRPLLGRTFVQGDDELGAEAVLVLSHHYWQQKFGADETVIGWVLEMNNRPHTVVGVLPPHPQFPRNNDVYMSTSACPFRANAQQNMHQSHRIFSGLQVFGRLAPGMTVDQAGAEVAGIASTFAKDHPADHQRIGDLEGRSVVLRDQLVEGARPMLLALVATTLLVLLIACANVANLALARTVRRSRELALRSALGAGRGRLLAQLVTESVLVALAGGALGLLLATWSLGLLVDFVGRFTPRTDQIAIDGGVLAFAFVVSVVTGIVFGAAPALSARRNVAQSIRDGSAQGGESGGRQRFRSGLVVSQVAVSFVLLVGAALLIQSVYRLAKVPLGYRTEQVVTAGLNGNFTRINSPEAALRVYGGALEGVRLLPGVQSAALTNAVPQSDIQPGPQAIEIEGVGEPDRVLQADVNVASDRYFETLDVPLLSGRDFRSSDTAEAPPVALINQTMAKFWEGRDPVGRRFRVPQSGQDPAWITVLGVVGDFRLYDVGVENPAQYYVPFAAQPFGGFRLLVRTAGNPIDVIPSMKAAVFAVDDQTPVEDIQTLTDLRRGKLASPALTAGLLGIFAGVALVVTLAGIAGLVGTSVSQRTREFGLRMALGASRASVLGLVLRQGFVLVLIGVVVGLGGAFWFSGLIGRFLFQTTPTDPLAYTTVAVIFVAAALLAAFGPARRATTIDPLKALRAD